MGSLRHPRTDGEKMRDLGAAILSPGLHLADKPDWLCIAAI